MTGPPDHQGMLREKAAKPCFLEPKPGSNVLTAPPITESRRWRVDLYRWLRPQTYAASADAWSAVNCDPPMAGIGLRYCFGCGTPSVITFKIPAKVPSLHNHLLLVRSGPSAEPVPFAPWQPAQAA